MPRCSPETTRAAGLPAQNRFPVKCPTGLACASGCLDREIQQMADVADQLVTTLENNNCKIRGGIQKKAKGKGKKAK